jgi:hypothetical protein
VFSSSSQSSNKTAAAATIIIIIGKREEGLQEQMQTKLSLMTSIRNSNLNIVQRLHSINENQCTDKLQHWPSAEKYKSLNRVKQTSTYGIRKVRVLNIN